MKKVLTVFFQIVVIFIALCALAFLLIEPHFEGRNSGATWIQIYFNDPFLLYAYVGSIPFFVAVYHIFISLKRHSLSIKSVRTIKHCILTFIAFIFGGLVYLFVFERGNDDIAGGVAVGLMLIVLSCIGAASAYIVERRLKKRGN